MARGGSDTPGVMQNILRGRMRKGGMQKPMPRPRGGRPRMPQSPPELPHGPWGGGGNSSPSDMINGPVAGFGPNGPVFIPGDPRYNPMPDPSGPDQPRLAPPGYGQPMMPPPVSDPMMPPVDPTTFGGYPPPQQVGMDDQPLTMDGGGGDMMQGGSGPTVMPKPRTGGMDPVQNAVRRVQSMLGGGAPGSSPFDPNGIAPGNPMRFQPSAALQAIHAAGPANITRGGDDTASGPGRGGFTSAGSESTNPGSGPIRGGGDTDGGAPGRPRPRRGGPASPPEIPHKRNPLTGGMAEMPPPQPAMPPEFDQMLKRISAGGMGGGGRGQAQFLGGNVKY
jgi:hypothetical protein